jgi:alanine-glyoxylate transaminase / (R)-3-amino-2-methylpropionate-pyruvate transaminase
MKAPDLPPYNYTPRPYTGPSAEEVLALRKEFLNPALSLFYRKPMMIVEGKGQYLFDEKGRRYLDGFAGIATVSVGHCHPDVVAAANLQNETLQHAPTM